MLLYVSCGLILLGIFHFRIEPVIRRWVSNRFSVTIGYIGARSYKRGHLHPEQDVGKAKAWLIYVVYFLVLVPSIWLWLGAGIVVIATIEKILLPW
jgi:hypothetical protein